MPIRFRSVLAVEGLETSDRRIIMPNALTWRDLPIPLMGLTEDNHGGMDNTSVNIGRIETIEREDAADLGDGVFRLVATGVLDDADPVGAEFARKIGEKYLRGISVDVGDVTAEMEVLEEDEDGWPLVVLDRLTAGRIGMATVCGFPAFAEAYIELADEPALVAAAALPASDLTLPQTTGPAWALTAGAIPVAPPAAWLRMPEPGTYTPLTITDDGQVYGHAAPWDVEHRGIPGATAPHSPTDYSQFHLHMLRCDDGKDVPVGVLTIGTGHADTRGVSAHAAAEHYDSTGSAWADVRAKDGNHGIWVCGAVRPDVDEVTLRRARGSSLSGDWRNFGQGLDMVALLSVNVPGFALVRPAMVASMGEPVALVAAGAAVAAKARPAPLTAEDVAAAAASGYATAAHLQERRLALRAVVQADLKARRAALRAKVRPDDVAREISVKLSALELEQAIVDASRDSRVSAALLNRPR